jgi:predicted RNA-binding protein YlxR (DUF448 family)
MSKKRHIPIRTCVACRETDEKRELLRVVRLPDGAVVYDPKGKLSGRGAYVCARMECIALAKKQKRLERSLKVTGVTAELFDTLQACAAEQTAPGEETPDVQGTPAPECRERKGL